MKYDKRETLGLHASADHCQKLVEHILESIRRASSDKITPSLREFNLQIATRQLEMLSTLITTLNHTKEQQ